MNGATLNQLLDRAAGFPGIGLRFLDRREEERFAEWSEIRERAREVAGGLAELGIEAGEPVVLIYPTGLDFVAAFFGILLAGAVPVPCYPPVRLGRLGEYHRRTAAMVRGVGARLVLAERRIARILGETVERARPSLGCRALEALPRVGPLAREVAPEDLALVQFSSGTTVEPKPVALSHRAVLSQVEGLNSFWPDEASSVVHSGVSWLPLYHDMGLIGCIFPALERPGILTLLGPEHFVTRPALWLRAISRYRATLSPAPNFAYGLCVAKISDDELGGVDLSSWWVALNGAETVVPEVLRAFERRFSRWGFRKEAMTPVYGMSEAALAVTFSDLGRPFVSRHFERESLAGAGVAREVEGPGGAVNGGEASGDRESREIVSVGRPLPGFELLIVPRDLSPASASELRAQALPPGRVGRIWVRGPSLMEGYLGQPEATARVLRDGFLDTGDLGFLHQGELFLTGRAKDVVILRGRNHAPEEIEGALAGVAGARTGCAVAVSHLAEGADSEELLVFVERARDAEELAVASLSEACRQAVLGALGLSAQVQVLEPGTLPRTTSGKLRRGETLRRYLAGELTPPHPVNPLRLAAAMTRSGLAYARARRGNRGKPEP